jgi:ribonuclease HI
MDEVFLSQPDQPISNLDVEYFTDGSSFVRDGMQFAGYVVVTLDSVTEACLLLVGTSAQKAELVALKQALHLAVGVWVTSTLTLNMPSQPFMSMWVLS